ncbi:PTS sugar transporter subunit IIB [Pectinatus frisingensis]|jgi:PTS system ascorbate-specific IIB component|uniref:PTS sugar transporter subunit IIB n=1 Tax=Pectinatus frisingensis TaxID=865 RepID=UPI0018C5D5A7|nr:PTS sugar transporter subunit IIB [Pectinatus frisingensis]
MNIITVCGMGMGSSLVLKMSVDDILTSHNINANVEACDLGSLDGRNADLVITTDGLRSQVEPKGYKTIYVHNVIDKSFIEKELLDALKK